uniref:F-box protein At4g19940-like n=1 Tax=Erigeron canadensis TaxID=72917 RepID=UPI001CB8C413|nr:F-box protein At4g19940-like [Erigeron canadensis]
MSCYDDIPTEIQIEIITRLDPKSLIRFSCVSKQLNSLIHSSKFVKDYTRNSRLIQQQQQQRRLFLVEKRKEGTNIAGYRSFADDDFPQNEPVPLFLPDSISGLKVLKVCGSSHGLLCLLGTYDKDYMFANKAVIWNPMIRKSVCIDLPKLYQYSSVGFGVCPKTCDPKIVRIDRIEDDDSDKYEDPEAAGCTNWKIMVFRLSSGEWRTIPPPPKWLDLNNGIYDDPAVADGFIYWLACEKSFNQPDKQTLVSFDLTTEVLKQVSLQVPADHQLSGRKIVDIFNFRESLAIMFKGERQPNYLRLELENPSQSFMEVFNSLIAII